MYIITENLKLQVWGKLYKIRLLKEQSTETSDMQFTDLEWQCRLKIRKQHTRRKCSDEYHMKRKKLFHHKKEKGVSLRGLLIYLYNSYSLCGVLCNHANTYQCKHTFIIRDVLVDMQNHAWKQSSATWWLPTAEA